MALVVADGGGGAGGRRWGNSEVERKMGDRVVVVAVDEGSSEGVWWQ